jgi:hypothetical protein
LRRPDEAPPATAPAPRPPAVAYRRRRVSLTAFGTLLLGAALGAAVVLLVQVPPRQSPAGAAPEDDPFAHAAAPAADTSTSLVAAAWSDDPSADVPVAPRVREGSVEVVVVSAALQRFAPDARAGAGVLPLGPPRLVVALRVRNASASSEVQYRPWSAGVSTYALPPRLRDDAGRTCRVLDIDPGAARPGAAPLRPGDAATDVLSFEAPVGTFGHIDLELPPENAGGRGPFPLTLRIPARAVSR